MLNRDQNVQECDATKDHSGGEADNIITQPTS